ncbi:hypothetical protein GVN21_01580 [Caulobacter sp. SLTY]|uniref:S41 family peptidase n=1 Tax=Caulobacter sp. SLTY TaxID=2683262 RepID=UPI00141311A7|nr:S41 family peptidase [Caulobacter sp. SLTY]NBB14042.1 hypothetical protein [Caulobacter sp. SLTY]
MIKGIRTVALALIGLLLLAAAPPASPDSQLYQPAALRADFEEMYRRLKGAHVDLYAFTPKAEMDQAYAATLARLDRPMTQMQAQVLFQTFLARARMGHTRIDFPHQAWSAFRAGGGKAFPLVIRPVGSRVWVSGNMSGSDQVARGDELLALEGQPIGAWLSRTGRHVSAETTYMRDSLLEFDFARLLWLEIGQKDRFTVTLRRGDRTFDVALAARTREEAAAFAAAQPPTLDLDTPMRQARMLRGGIAYLRPGPFYNAEAQVEADMYDARGFIAFTDKAFEDFIAARATDLIIDLRGNPGGDNAFSDPMIAWFADRPFRFFSSFKVKVSLEAIAANQARIDHDPVTAGDVSQIYARLYASAKPGDIVDFPMPQAQPRTGRRFKGRVWLLIDRQSYSNTVSVAALVQDYGFGKVLGEPTSDMASTYGAMERFTLANTGLSVGFPKARIIRPNGDRRSRGVTPDIPIRSPIVQTPADEMLAQTVAAVKTRR